MIFDDFFDGLESDAGEIAWRAADDTQMALAGASVDLNDRKIIWADGERLSIDQSAVKIKLTSEIEIKMLQYQIILWLEMEFVPEDLNEKEMVIFEEQIDQWIKDYNSGIQ